MNSIQQQILPNKDKSRLKDIIVVGLLVLIAALLIIEATRERQQEKHAYFEEFREGEIFTSSQFENLEWQVVGRGVKGESQRAGIIGVKPWAKGKGPLSALQTDDTSLENYLRHMMETEKGQGACALVFDDIAYCFVERPEGNELVFVYAYPIPKENHVLETQAISNQEIATFQNGQMLTERELGQWALERARTLRQNGGSLIVTSLNATDDPYALEGPLSRAAQFVPSDTTINFRVVHFQGHWHFFEVSGPNKYIYRD